MIISIRGKHQEVNDLSTKQIIDIYNELAFELDEAQVNRFANRTKAESRLAGIADRHTAKFAAKALTPEEIADLEDEELCTTGSLNGEQNGFHWQDAPNGALELSPADAQQIEAEAEARKPAPTPRPAAPASVGAPRWSRAKEEAPSRVAYRPRPGSSQAFMYSLLAREGGVNIEHFCQQMRDSGIKDKTLHAPAGVWSCLRYLFVHSKGYGLKFDGKNIELLRPADERDAKKADS